MIVKLCVSVVHGQLLVCLSVLLMFLSTCCHVFVIFEQLNDDNDKAIHFRILCCHDNIPISGYLAAPVSLHGYDELAYHIHRCCLGL